MKITRIKLFIVNVPERHWWWSDDVYGQPEHQRAEHGVAEVETDQGLTGLTQIERSMPRGSMEGMLNDWLGQNVLEVNLADPCTSSFRQLVLDLRGQALGVPIWQLQGGRLRDRIPVTQCTGYKTPNNTAVDALRPGRLETVTTFEAPERATANLASSGPGPDRQAEQRLMLRDVEAGLRRLRPDHRTALLLRVQDERSYVDIAYVMGVAEGTAKSYVHRARRQLAADLGRAGWGGATDGAGPRIT